MLSKLERIEKFVASDRPNEWLQLGSLQLYLRKATHFLGDKAYRTLDIPNIYYRKESDLGQGTFTGLIRGMEAMLPKYPEFEALVVENVLTPRFGAYLERNGWTKVPDAIGFGGVFSYYKLLK